MITSIVLHYKRPENVPKWLEGIRKQTVDSKIFVWDNSGDFPNEYKKDIDLYINSSQNLYCQPRVLMSGFVQTEYIYNQDDDLAMKDPDLFEKFLEVATKYPDHVIGWNGRLFSPDINWDKAYQSPGKGWVDAQDINDKISIHMINYGVSFLRTALINQLPINPFMNDTRSIKQEDYKYADDIYVSAWLKYKRVMPFKLLDHYHWLNEYQERNAALSKQPKHMDARNKACRDYFQEKYGG